ncbi:type II secretion system F family protein [Aliiroseovarius crassostreae]|uniref:type II secretion system F family protein n=1 Tax=Aliiroseovarius crassostreae TaxID=154981 RepID=UPI00220E288C|nr:type II secretion system F family protein [Aliiroseovarius crassostreae]UWQ00400.1 type II secretion system F family protein [Aliiroseovarius crassostreae]
MKSFEVTARDATGKEVVSTRQAPSKDRLRQTLLTEGLLVSCIREQRVWRFWRRTSGTRRKSLRENGILSLLRELRTILGAGLSVTEALSMVETRPNNAPLTQALRDINQEVRRGKPLAQAVRERPHMFEPALATTLQIGMSSGDLDMALERYETDLSTRIELRRKFRKAMTYPLFLLGLLAVVLVVLFTLILPNFVDLYSEFGAELPWATQFLIRAVETTPLWGGAIIAGTGLSWLGMNLLGRTTSGRRWLDQITLSFPLYGPLQREGYMVQLASGLSLLLHSGMPLKSAIDLMANTLPNTVLVAALHQIGAGLNTGRRFSDLCHENGLFTGAGEGLLRAGERTGALAQMLHHIARLHEQDLGDRVDVVTSLIEPVLMVLVGAVIGVIVIVVYLPIFGITNVIG